jgi:MtN3 and saliva related transmembrane protein
VEQVAMIFDLTELLGYSAGFCTTVAFLPQVIRSVRTRSTKDLSLLMLVLFSTGLTLWTIYGICEDRPPIVAANGITLVFVCVLFWLRLRYGSRESAC